MQFSSTNRLLSPPLDLSQGFYSDVADRVEAIYRKRLVKWLKTRNP